MIVKKRNRKISYFVSISFLAIVWAAAIFATPDRSLMIIMAIALTMVIYFLEDSFNLIEGIFNGWEDTLTTLNEVQEQNERLLDVLNELNRNKEDVGEDNVVEDIHEDGN